ncbi:MAG: hypothetical protein GY839_16185 [candidate division Zixibacteria bacterium]|nr:hypothetical protein [candidate division Zixibacteria bacterium]
MKKALLTVVLLLALAVMVSAQEYWNLKTSIKGIDVMPGDGNNMGIGAAAVVTFGAPDGQYDFGFEAAKWWRTFDEVDSEVAELIGSGDIVRDNADVEVDQGGLKFSALGKYKVFSLISEGKLDLYTGAGAGFYFLQESREEARQNPATGLWAVEKIDKYLDTKGQSFILMGLDGDLYNNLNIFLEARFTYIFDWDRWDDPYEIGSALGLRYDF